MKLEQQVCSLELAKKLKELGVKQVSYFWWSGNDKDGMCVRSYDNLFRYPGTYSISAFTVAELGEMLPKKLEINEVECELLWKPDAIAYGYYQWEVAHIYQEIDEETTEADARAKMLVYLIENDLIKI